ncbi:recombinase family protein [Paracoccus beibuensis]|uniref:recombinase family protein n=1 Tax=Paracoccus beibuensis TaxID=547602 RepID=UPI002AD3CC03|nr:recombinase family protein [Paracoccus beibuensis]
MNEREILTDLDRLWTRATVHQILTNEKYIGNYIYNQRSFKLKRKRITTLLKWPKRCRPSAVGVRAAVVVMAIAPP